MSSLKTDTTPAVTSSSSSSLVDLFIPHLLDKSLSSETKLQRLKQYDSELQARFASDAFPLFQACSPFLMEPDPLLKGWVMDLLHLALVKFQLPLPVQAQVSCTCIQAVTNLLQDPSHQVVRTAIQVLGPMTAVFFAMAIQDASYVPTWQAMLQLRNSLLPLLQQTELHISIQYALLKYLQRMILLLSSGTSEDTTQEGISLHLLSVYHPLLQREALSKEGASMLHQLIDLITSGSGSPSRISLSLHLLLQIATIRPAFAPHVAMAWTSWPHLPHHPFKQDRWSRLLKYGLMHLSKHCQLPAALQTKVSVHLVQWGGKHIKSNLTQKKKTESSDRKLFAEMLQQLDLQALPLPMLIEMILQSLQILDMEELKEAIQQASDVHFASAPPVSMEMEAMQLNEPAMDDEDELAMDDDNDEKEIYEEDEKKDHKDLLMDEEEAEEEEEEAAAMLPYTFQPSEAASGLHDLHAIEIMSRILQSESLFPTSHSTLSDPPRTIWLSMVTRLLGKVYPTSAIADQVYQLFVDFVCADFKKRHGYAIHWLYHLPSPTRSVWFNLILDRVWRLEHHTTLLRFILTSPSPPFQDVLPFLETHASHTPTCLMTCVWVCKELMEYRPKYRGLAFEVVCRLSKHALKQVRTPTILTLKQVYPHPVLAAPLVKFAKSGLLDPHPSSYELMFALCAKSPSLFSELFLTYKDAPNQKLIRKEMESLLKAISYSEELYQAISTFPDGSESVVLKILVVLMEKEEPSNAWVEMVYKLYKERGLSGKFLLPIIGKLSQDTILSDLRALVKLIDGSEQSKKIWKEVVSRICDGESPLIPPTLFIISLHQLEDKMELKKLIQALDIAIMELPSIFKHEDLAKAFQKLLDSPPTLFMRTVLSALQVHPSLTSFMKNVLIKLTSKQIWTQKTLWEGFLRVFQKTLPKSVTVIFNLPPQQAQEVLQRVQGAKACVLEFIDTKQLHKQPRVMALAEVLGLDEGSPESSLSIKDKGIPV